MRTQADTGHLAFSWKGNVRFLVPHANGEEYLVMERTEDGQVSSSWTGEPSLESLEAMGWESCEAPLPEDMRRVAQARLAEDREPPSDILASLLRP